MTHVYTSYRVTIPSGSSRLPHQILFVPSKFALRAIRYSSLIQAITPLGAFQCLRHLRLPSMTAQAMCHFHRVIIFV